MAIIKFDKSHFCDILKIVVNKQQKYLDITTIFTVCRLEPTVRQLVALNLTKL